MSIAKTKKFEGLTKELLLEKVTEEGQKLKHVMQEHPKLSLIKENRELEQKINELGIEIDEQKDKIKKALFGSEHAGTVEKNLINLGLCMEDCLSYFDELNNTTVMFLTKSKLKRRAETVTQSLRSKTTQLLTSVTLELLLQSTGDQPPPVPQKVLSDEKDWPDYYTFFYGLLGHPINYSTVVESATSAAEEGYPRAMLMLAKCYAGGLGVEEDKPKAIEWLEKASELGLMEAKIDLALLFLSLMKNRKDACLRLISQPQAKRVEEERRSGNSFALLAVSVAQQEKERKEDDKLLTRATELLLAASDNGYALAETYLGVIAEDSGDYTEAKKWFGFGAKRGCPDAINRLGLLHYFGKGVPRNTEQAFALFVSSAIAGNRDALNNVGTCYENGEGVVRNLNEALLNYEKGAKRGCPDSMYSLGYLLIKRYIVSLRAFESGSRMEDNSLMRPQLRDSDKVRERVADMSMSLVSNGSFSESRAGSYRISSRDREELLNVATEGIRWLRKAAELDIVEASYQLGRVYQQGIGTPVDMSAAFIQFEWAAKQGHSKAAEIAGDMKYGGIGTLEDPLLAAFFYRIAAEGGVAGAMNSLAVLLENGNGTSDRQPLFHEAAKWYFESTQLGFSDAAINLANLLARVSLPRVQLLSGDIVTASQIRRFLEEKVTVNAKFSGQFDRALTLLDHALVSNNEVSASESPLHHGSFLSQSQLTERDDFISSESFDPSNVQRAITDGVTAVPIAKPSMDGSQPSGALRPSLLPEQGTSTRRLSDQDKITDEPAKPTKPSKWGVVRDILH